MRAYLEERLGRRKWYHRSWVIFLQAMIQKAWQRNQTCILKLPMVNNWRLLRERFTRKLTLVSRITALKATEPFDSQEVRSDTNQSASKCFSQNTFNLGNLKSHIHRCFIYIRWKVSCHFVSRKELFLWTSGAVVELASLM